MEETKKTSMQPSYWAVVPAGIRYDDRIPANAKLLYAEISALTGKTGYCFAPDSYFADLYRITERSVRRLLAALESEGYIRVERRAGQHNSTMERRIYAGINPLYDAPFSSDKKVQTGTPVRTKKSGSLDKKVQTHIIYQEILSNTPIAPKSEALLRKLDPEIAKAIAAASDRRPELLEAWLDFAEARRAKGAPIRTVRTVELLDRKLRNLSKERSDTAVKILEQSIERGWTGFFHLKEEITSNTTDGSYWAQDPEG